MKQSLSEKIYEDIKRQILCLQFETNEILTEQAVAHKYGVSKTPAREALNRLCMEGFITLYPSSGYFIKTLTLKDLLDISQLRLILETAAVQIIVEKTSDEEIASLQEILGRPIDTFIRYTDANIAFHAKLGELTGNEYLKNTITQMVNAGSRPSIFNRFTSETKPSNHWHQAITDALMQRREKEALEALRQDIAPERMQSILKQLSETGDASFSRP